MGVLLLLSICFLELSEYFRRDSKKQVRISHGKRAIGAIERGLIRKKVCFLICHISYLLYSMFPTKGPYITYESFKIENKKNNIMTSATEPG